MRIETERIKQLEAEEAAEDDDEDDDQDEEI